MLERPGGGSYLFNRRLFSPVRTDGAPEAIRVFLKKQAEAVAELPEPLLDLLRHHHIVVRPNGRDGEPAGWSQAKWWKVLQNAPFVIRMPTRVTSMSRVRAAFRTTLEHLRSKSASNQIPPLHIKFIWNGTYPARPLSDVGSLIRFALGELGSLDAADFWLELPIERVVQWGHRLRLATVPPLGVTCALTAEPGEPQIAVLRDLVSVGFRPHCVLYITSENLAQARRTVDCLATHLERDGFSFAIMPAPRWMFASDHIHGRLLPSAADLVDLLRYCHGHEGLDLRQSWLYADVYERVRNPGYVFPCRVCAGRGIYIDEDGRFCACHKVLQRDPMAPGDDVAQALRSPCESLFGGSEWAKSTCSRCPLRYLCGGICEFAAADVADPDLGVRLFELHCAMRREVLLTFFEDATCGEVEASAYRTRFRFVSGDGMLDFEPVNKRSESP